MRRYEILLVDDDPILLAGMGKDLESEGYNVTGVQNGEKANTQINHKHFDLVITDLVMDRVDGIQVLERAKAKSADTMVIILTGYGDLASAIKALRQNADDYLLKPCDPDALRFRVRRCVERLEFRRKIKIYEKMLPICCACKKIRDDSGKTPGTGEWFSIEAFLMEKAGIHPTSTYCPHCAEQVKNEIKAGEHLCNDSDAT